MKILAFLPVFILFWPMVKIAKKAWRLFAVLLLIGLMGGCANSSNKLDKSPCACKFEPINTRT